MTIAPPKLVYLNGDPIGTARSWAEVDAMLIERRVSVTFDSARFEGRGAFYVAGKAPQEHVRDSDASDNMPRVGRPAR